MTEQKNLEKIIKVNKAEIAKVLRGYFPEIRYMKSAEIRYFEFYKADEKKYPKITGKFQIPKSFYYDTEDQKGHLTAVETMLCLDQLGFVFLNEIQKQNLVKDVPSLSEDEYKKWLIDGFFITGFDKVRFRKPIDASKEFEGEAAVTNIGHRRKKTSYVNLKYFFMSFDFNFDNGKIIGKLSTALAFNLN